MPRRGRLKRRLKALRASEDEGRRDLGVLVLDMYRRDDLDLAALGERAADLWSLSTEIEEVDLELGEGANERPSEEVQARERLGYPAAEVPPASGEGDAAEPVDTEAPEPIEAVAGADHGQAARAPAPAALDELRAELEQAEERRREVTESAGGDAEEGAVAEILALEEDLDREQQRAAEVLEQATAQLQASQTSEERPAPPADEGIGAAEARAAAAEWLRGQARAMRREAERQVRDEFEGARREIDQLAQAEAEKRIHRENERLRAELEQRHRGETERLRGELEQRHREEIEAAQAAGREQAEAELRPIVERADRDRIEAERALAEMTDRSNEANRRAQRSEAELEQARRSGHDAEGSLQEELDRRLAEQTEHLREQLKLVREESDHRRREAEAARERARELAERGDALRAERDDARARLRASEGRPEPPQAPVPQAEGRPAEPVAEPAGDRIDLNDAGFEQLREVGMSVTQANRVIAYRDRLGGYRSVDDLDAVPGFPRALLTELKQRLQA